MYVKKYDENGLLTNPITKEKPYITISNRREKRFKQRKCNNRKGTGMVVYRDIRYKILKQFLPSGKVIVHSLPA